MPEDQPALAERPYVQSVLELYRHHPHTTGRVRKADRLLAVELLRQGIAIESVNVALLLVAARRSLSPERQPPPIRSLHYFLPAIREILDQPLDNDYIRYLKRFKQADNRQRDHHLP